jgi:hypothetical protein
MITAIIISAIAGATIGYTIAAMLMIGRRSEPKAPPKEPTMLLTVGSIVKFNGMQWEIEELRVGVDNQTLALIRNGDITTWCYIDDLEVVDE